MEKLSVQKGRIQNQHCHILCVNPKYLVDIEQILTKYLVGHGSPVEPLLVQGLMKLHHRHQVSDRFDSSVLITGMKQFKRYVL